MPAGASKREQEYRELEHRFKRERRYPGREEEVAARVVNKQRRQFGETRAAKQQAKEGRSPDRGLPLQDYERLTIAQITAQLASLSPAQLKQIRVHESRHKNRKGLIARLDRLLDRP
ncbi:MAG TPA: hypothetical protein VEC01_00200 [Noviherbaspirillum sp.]|uniref:hypothetical protein n=1 Tax=Noviherbaspirillum sp. TaxID=1926288 RepID=UPI002D4654C1|nr:hypothetical protein [Noviherbaspirillum sp.]HYD93712.1 hypothetical protein [Noviherbaspirillum sp.]